jgi:hypothetical protein
MYYRDAGMDGSGSSKDAALSSVPLALVRVLPGGEKPLRRKSLVPRYLESQQKPMRESA